VIGQHGFWQCASLDKKNALWQPGAPFVKSSGKATDTVKKHEILVYGDALALLLGSVFLHHLNTHAFSNVSEEWCTSPILDHLRMDCTGPKISSLAMLMSSVTLLKTVGSK
jgi:hypothetical protein